MNTSVPPVYRKLRRHLDELPVGFPRTPSDAGLRLLRFLFTGEQAAVALGMDHRFRTADEIRRRLGGESPAAVEAELDRMAARGAVLRRDSEAPPRYALLPYIVGMFELQLKRLGPEFLRDSSRFMYQGYAAEFLSGGVRQSRIIPIEETVSEKHRVAGYNDLRRLIADAGERIAVVDCICRVAKDLSGGSCAYTKRRELCMVFRDFADTVVREGWGRKLSRDEALEIARQNEKEGLVLQPSNEQEPQFICACCGDCCGLLAFAKVMPKPAEFMESPYFAEIDADACTGCGACLRRCHMDALRLHPAVPSREVPQAEDRPRRAGRAVVRVDPDRCIGCGACVPVCPAGALSLREKSGRAEPPRDTEALMEALLAGRRRGLRKAAFVVKTLAGIAWSGIRRSTR